jgi:hypothetical protein
VLLLLCVVRLMFFESRLFVLLLLSRSFTCDVFLPPSLPIVSSRGGGNEGKREGGMQKGLCLLFCPLTTTTARPH